MRFEVFTSVAIMAMFFGVYVPFGLAGRTIVSEKRAVSIFRAEVMMLGIVIFFSGILAREYNN
jgi:hypothetical protein